MSNALHVPGDAATAQTAQGTRSPVYPRLVIATTIMASSLAFIDGSVVNVGLPAIGRSFHADAIGLQWVVNAYLLPLSALLLLGGAAGARRRGAARPASAAHPAAPGQEDTRHRLEQDSKGADLEEIRG